MGEVEKALLPHLDGIVSAPYPMAAAAEKLLELGAGVFGDLLAESGIKAVYIGGINVDYDANQPGNNLFVPKTATIFEQGTSRQLNLN